MQHNTNGKTVSICSAAAAALPDKKAVTLPREAARARPSPAADRADLDRAARVQSRSPLLTTMAIGNKRGEERRGGGRGGEVGNFFLIFGFCYYLQYTSVRPWHRRKFRRNGVVNSGVKYDPSLFDYFKFRYLIYIQKILHNNI